MRHTQGLRLNFMKNDSINSKPPNKTSLNQDPLSPTAANILDTFNTITLSARVPEGTDPRSIERLIHDLRSAANAFSFLVDQLASELEKSSDDRHRRKLNQLRQHDAVNKNCMDIMIKCLERQIIQA